MNITGGWKGNLNRMLTLCCLLFAVACPYCSSCLPSPFRRRLSVHKNVCTYMLPSQSKRNSPRIPIPGTIPFFSVTYVRQYLNCIQYLIPCLPAHLCPFFTAYFPHLRPNTRLSSNPTLWSPIHNIFDSINVSSRRAVKTRGGGGVHTPAAGTLHPVLK